MREPLHPLRFRPVYRDYPWGGRRLAEIYRRAIPPGPCAESWELSDRDDGMSVVAAGFWEGRTLRSLVESLGPALVGAPVTRFPLLIKLIDAAARTSVQVHPDEAAAARLGGEPKTETWYALPESASRRVFAGLAPGVDRAAFERAARTGEIEPLLRPVALAPGEAVLIPGGRVHAIEAGSLLIEIQQNSDTTLRVFDWGRTSRPLHLAQAMETIRWDDPPARAVRPRPVWRRGANALAEIVADPRFRVTRLELGEALALESDGRGFRALFVERGAILARGGGIDLALERGASGLLPAALRECTLQPEGGPATVIVAEPGVSGV